MEPHAIGRLPAKLELHCYIIRERTRTNTIVSLLRTGLPRPMPVLLRWDGCGWNRNNRMPTQAKRIGVEA